MAECLDLQALQVRVLKITHISLLEATNNMPQLSFGWDFMSNLQASSLLACLTGLARWLATTWHVLLHLVHLVFDMLHLSLPFETLHQC